MAFLSHKLLIIKSIDLDQHVAFLYRFHTKTMFPKFTSFLYRVLGKLDPNMAGYQYDF